MPGRILHLLRHGAVARPGRLLGHRDTPATPDGIADCVRRVTGVAFDAVVSSDLARAAVAATTIADARGLPVMIDPRWRELDFGAWDGLLPADIPADARAQFYDDPDAFPPPGGESWGTLRTRVQAAIRDLAGGASPALVVTHGGAMRAALAELAGLTHRETWAFALPCASLLSLRLFEEGGGAQIVGLST